MRGYILLIGIAMLIGSFILGELASLFVPLTFITKNFWFIMPMAIGFTVFGIVGDPKLAATVALVVFVIIIVSDGSLLNSIKSIGGGS